MGNRDENSCKSLNQRKNKMTIEELKEHQKKSMAGTKSATTKEEKTKDPRFWEPTITDKDTKTSRAIIRPLSCVADEDQNVVVQTSHFIKRNNRNYSFICPKTAGKGHKCPVCERYWSKAYGDRDLELKPKRKWLMNIYVVDDSGKPENNGKVFLWACPKTIWDKIETAQNAEYEEDRVENIFDMWEGANILIRTKDKAGFMNYEDSQIRPASKLFADVADNDPKYIKVAESVYPLKEFMDPSTMKTYGELAQMLNEIDSLVDDRVDSNPAAYVKKHNLADDINAKVQDEVPETFAEPEEVTSDDEFFSEFEE